MSLAKRRKKRLRRLGYSDVELKIADGYHGWSEHAPFDKVIVTAAPDLLPPLIHQLTAGGKMVIPADLPNTQRKETWERPGNIDANGMDRPRSRPRRFSECVGGLSEQEHRHASHVDRSRSYYHRN
jgi:protein-L-isoaspartate(D-aspartate) O-methyltransferase